MVMHQTNVTYGEKAGRRDWQLGSNASHLNSKSYWYADKTQDIFPVE